VKYFKGLLTGVIGVLLAGATLAEESPGLDEATVQAGLMAAAPVKLSVAEQFAKTGVWADSSPSANVDAGDEGQPIVAVGVGGIITIAYSSGAEIVLTPADGGNGRVNWSCSTKAMPAELIPKGCTPAA